MEKQERRKIWKTRRNHKGQPVFFDPSEHRRVALITAAAFFVVLFAGLMVLGIYRLIQAPVITTPDLGDQVVFPDPARQPYRGEPAPESAIDQGTAPAVNETTAARGDGPSGVLAEGVMASPFEVYAFLPRWPERGLDQLVAHAAQIDVVLPEWYQVESADGSITAIDPEWLAITAGRIARSEQIPKVIPVIQLDGADGSTGFATSAREVASRQRMATALGDLARERGYDGFCLNVAGAGVSDRANIVELVHVLRAELSPRGKAVCLVLPLAADRVWLQAAGQAADVVVLVAIDQESYDARPMPLASQDWFEASLSTALSVVDPAKMVIAIGQGGLDWTSGSVSPVAIPFLEAARLSGRRGQPIVFDAASRNSRLEFADQEGKRHTVWLLDAASAYNQMVTALAGGLGHIAIQSPGTMDPGVWAIMASGGIARHDPSAAQELTQGSYVGVEGEGALLKVTGKPQTGHRVFALDQATGLIKGQTYRDLPHAYTVTRWGGGHHDKVALTFDDGPDPATTGKLLDILKAEKVPATFFVVGSNAQRRPEFIRRIVDEGHELGNHFYLHSAPQGISETRLRLEVNATQRLIAGLTGRYTIFARPPYGVEEPAALEATGSIAALTFISDAGYLIANADIDPQDWRSASASDITDSIVAAVRAGKGSVIVMHDAGGDRSETIKALPQLIAAIRAEGLAFTSLSDLIGLTRDEVMPLATDSDVAIDSYGFSFFRGLNGAINAFFAIAVVLSIIRTLFVCLMVLFRRRHRETPLDGVPDVTVVIPAYNEEQVILKTIASVLQSPYPKLNVIVIDDGSTDATFDLASGTYRDDPRVRVERQENAGKASALNLGYFLAESEIIVAIDADTVLLPDAIGYLAAHFADPAVAAVAGNAKVGNRNNLLTRMQAMEYIVAQNLDRKAFERLNCITVVPGAIGAWRRSAVLDAGGYPDVTVAEDADLTVSLLRRGHRVVYEERAIALTEAPQAIGPFMRQRFRWTYGMLQTAWRHRRAILEPHLAGWIIIPNILGFQVVFQLLAPVVDLVFLDTLANVLMSFVKTHSFAVPPQLQAYLFYYVVFLFADVVLALFAFAGEPKENKRLIWLALLQRFFYRQIMYLVAIRTVLAALRGDLVGWGKLRRLSSVQLPPQTT